MLFGWNSGSRCLTRTLVSKLCRFQPHRKLSFRMGPKLCRVTILFCSHVFQLATKICMLFELVRKVLHQNISLDRVLSDSGQNCLDFSPHRKLSFWMGPKLCPVPRSSHSLAVGPIEFFVPRINSGGFRSHQ